MFYLFNFLLFVVGDIVLQNLELKAEALTDLNLPIDVVKGILFVNTIYFIITFLTFLNFITQSITNANPHFTINTISIV